MDKSSNNFWLENISEEQVIEFFKNANLTHQDYFDVESTAVPIKVRKLDANTRTFGTCFKCSFKNIPTSIITDGMAEYNYVCWNGSSHDIFFGAYGLIDVAKTTFDDAVKNFDLAFMNPDFFMEYIKFISNSNIVNGEPKKYYGSTFIQEFTNDYGLFIYEKQEKAIEKVTRDFKKQTKIICSLNTGNDLSEEELEM